MYFGVEVRVARVLADENLLLEDSGVEVVRGCVLVSGIIIEPSPVASR